MKYFVVATHWDDNKKAQVNHIVGQFDDRINADLFRRAYDDFYSTRATIVKSFDMVNK